MLLGELVLSLLRTSKTLRRRLMGKWRLKKGQAADGVAMNRPAIGQIGDVSVDQAEAVMEMLGNGAFDEGITKAVAKAIALSDFAQPVPFDELEEVDIEAWAKRRGIELPNLEADQPTTTKGSES